MLADTVELKKKGRPQSEHYVKESELRDEIELSQKNKESSIAKMAEEWDKKIDALSTEPEKASMRD